MRALHKLCDPKELIRTWQQFFQVKADNTYTANPHFASITPTAEVFGTNLIEANEVLYFKGKDWETAKMHKAVTISREGLWFTAKDRKGNILGTCKAQTELIDRFPDSGAVFPSTFNAVVSSGFNPTYFAAMVEALGGYDCELTFTTLKGPVRFRNKETKAIGILMPLFVEID